MLWAMPEPTETDHEEPEASEPTENEDGEAEASDVAPRVATKHSMSSSRSAAGWPGIAPMIG